MARDVVRQMPAFFALFGVACAILGRHQEVHIVI